MTQQGNIFDTFVKDFFCVLVTIIDFLQNYADREFLSQIDLDKIQPAPTHYVGKDGREKILDLLFECPLKTGEGNLMAVIVFEHQSDSLEFIPLKLLRYICAIWESEYKAGKKILSAPYFIVLRTGEKPHIGPYPKLSGILPKTSKGKIIGKLVDIEYDVVDLPAWGFDQLVGGPVLRLVFGVLKKMTEGQETEFPEAFKPLSEITDQEYRIELTKTLMDFVDRAMQAHNIRLDETKIREALQYAFPEYERSENMIVSLFEEKYLAGEAKGRAEGRAEGEAKGEAKGRIEGEIAAKIETIFLFLADRFEGVPKKLEKKIQKITNIDKLNELVKLSVKCESLKEFEKTLNS